MVKVGSKLGVRLHLGSRFVQSCMFGTIVGLVFIIQIRCLAPEVRILSRAGVTKTKISTSVTLTKMFKRTCASLALSEVKH